MPASASKLTERFDASITFADHDEAMDAAERQIFRWRGLLDRLADV